MIKLKRHPLIMFCVKNRKLKIILKTSFSIIYYRILEFCIAVRDVGVLVCRLWAALAQN
jgi:hypothetical protein